VWRTQARESNRHSSSAGEILAATKDGIDVACGTGVLRLLEIQRAGGRRMAVADYLNSRPELRRP
jgi:methionyl-tRNA formyltransferase